MLSSGDKKKRYAVTYNTQLLGEFSEEDNDRDSDMMVKEESAGF